MRLGLIGTGKQAQRYLDPKNGGDYVVKQLRGRPRVDEYRDWLEGLDGVIIATHPSNHHELGMIAIGMGKHVLIEKPLALNLAECEDLLSLAEASSVLLQIAHLDLWAAPDLERDLVDASCFIRYAQHERDYSPWLDWAPHGLALLNKLGCCDWRSVDVAQGLPDVVLKRGRETLYSRYPFDTRTHTPMWLMLRDFARGVVHSPDFHRTIYRELFKKEDRWQPATK